MHTFNTQADYRILVQCDTYVVLEDLDKYGQSVTDDVHRVIHELNRILNHGLGARKIYYRNAQSDYEELILTRGQFEGFAPCSSDQKRFLAKRVGEKT